MLHLLRQIPRTGQVVLPIIPTVLVFCCADEPASAFPAKVVTVQDGDTLTVLRDGRRIKVRLNGIDAPELRQPFGWQARDYLTRLTAGKIVDVRPLGCDRYRRMVADVVLPDGVQVNAELVRSGHAWWYRKYAPHSIVLPDLEERAKIERRGLWQTGSPQAPWDFRTNR